MNIIAFAPKYNKPGKKDATGAFQPEMTRFSNHWKLNGATVSSYIIDNNKRKTAMMNDVMDIISKDNAMMPLTSIVFFCHGLSTRIQFGISIYNAYKFAKLLADLKVTSYVDIVCYSCSVAKDVDPTTDDTVIEMGGDGGFCDVLRDELCRAGLIWNMVVGHCTVGHASKNPFGRLFPGGGFPDGQYGGSFIITPKSPLWGKWVAALRTDFRFQYPYLSPPEILKYLNNFRDIQ